MFNDELTEEQGRLLISNLSECAWPFQCAHGRPSLVSPPVLESAVNRRELDWDRLKLLE